MSQIYLYTDNLILYSRLGCWCKPQQCHGDVLVELVNQFCSDDDQTIEPRTETKVDVNAPEPKVELFNFDDDFPSLGSKPSNTVVQQKKISCQQPIRHPPFVPPCDGGELKTESKFVVNDDSSSLESKLSGKNHQEGKSLPPGERNYVPLAGATKQEKVSRAEAEQKTTTDDVKSKRRRHRTPHLHTKRTITPKWHGAR